MQIDIDIRYGAEKLNERGLEKCIRTILEILKLPEAELSVVVVDDEEIARLNRQYFDREGPTNVISFPMQEGEGAQFIPDLLGDVVVSLDTAFREAEGAGMDPIERLHALIAHGVLHLIGYDHENDAAEARIMEEQEKKIMEQLIPVDCSEDNR